MQMYKAELAPFYLFGYSGCARMLDIIAVAGAGHRYNDFNVAMA